MVGDCDALRFILAPDHRDDKTNPTKKDHSRVKPVSESLKLETATRGAMSGTPLTHVGTLQYKIMFNVQLYPPDQVR